MADSTTPAQWFVEEFTVQLGGVLEALAGERPKLAISSPPPGAVLATSIDEIGRKHGAMLWWELRFPLPGDPSLCVGAPLNAWSALAGRILGAAGLDDDSQARETYLEVLQQSLGELSRSAGRRWHRSIDGSGKEAAAPPTGEFHLVEATYPDATIPPLVVVIGGAPEDPQEIPKEANSPAPAETLSGEPHPKPLSRTFDLLMGVELPVSVSFGHVQIPLKDVLKLTAGSIIELNRSVDEPVEVIVNNCVVARGEVVVVEGNYGVRIHQIMSRQERLENLP